MARELRDISNFQGEADLIFLQKKIAAAGEMKTAIKRLLDEALPLPTPAGGGVGRHSTRKPHGKVVPTQHLNEVRKAMEDYLNVH